MIVLILVFPLRIALGLRQLTVSRRAAEVPGDMVPEGASTCTR